MRPVAEMPAETALQIKLVFTDIDDTVTTDGRLTASAYTAMEQLQEAGIHVVPVTGRPAGWCDMIARFWPVSGVVGENGAFYFAYDEAHKIMRRRFFASDEERAANRARLNALSRDILQAVPGAAISADQLYREADLAIDFCEDVEPLAPADILRIQTMFEAVGAVAKISSIHVNGWFGDYDNRFFSQCLRRCQCAGVRRPA